MNAALLDRLENKVELFKPSNSDLIQIVTRKSGVSETVAKKIVEASEKISKKIKEEDLTNCVITTRGMIAWAKRSNYEGLVEAAEHTILPGCSYFDNEIAKEIKDAILLPCM